MSTPSLHSDLFLPTMAPDLAPLLLSPAELILVNRAQFVIPLEFDDYQLELHRIEGDPPPGYVETPDLTIWRLRMISAELELQEEYRLLDRLLTLDELNSGTRMEWRTRVRRSGAEVARAWENAQEVGHRYFDLLNESMAS